MTLPYHLSAGILLVVFLGSVAVAPLKAAEPLTVDASAKAPLPRSGGFKLGTSKNPQGHEITVNSLSLVKDGKPWLAVMGEIHFSRYPAGEWRDELLKMKAGGITIVSTYVFWIHHEEVKDQWDWSGQRNLRGFIQACADVGLPLIVRVGPWCHGEVRNGGLPDYVVEMGRRIRTNDPEYMARATNLYKQIAEQIKGLQWKDGGPIIGMQFENEFSGAADHLMALKKIALDAGVDLPIYTKTGWPAMRTPPPFGEMLPLQGGYAEGFWDNVITPMPGKYSAEFLFSPVRTNATVGTDQLGNRDATDESLATDYPYLTCELGGGMMTSYHRRILNYSADVVANALVKIGSGSNLPGYYMYHGGTNPNGKLTTLEESQATNYPNDMPIKTYDFQAPLGEFGQLRPHYHELRRLHLFLNDCGSDLAYMPSYMPTEKPANPKDAQTLRWVVRSNGQSGYVFVNNYQRLQDMPRKDGVQFDVKLAGGKSVRFPLNPISVPADAYFVWPFNLDLNGITLSYATAQPICKIDDGDTTYAFFAVTDGIPPEFVFAADGTTVETSNGGSGAANTLHFKEVKPSLEPVIKLKSRDGKKLAIILLDSADSLALWKGNIAGKDRVLLSKAGLMFDHGKLRISSLNNDLTAKILEAGIFKPLDVKPPAASSMKITLEEVKPVGPARELKQGRRGRIEMPGDADFDQAAVWRVKFPNGLDRARDYIIRLKYVGDVARIYSGDQFLTDNFYNGTPFDLGLKRYGDDIYKNDLLIKILPMRKDAPLYLANEAKPEFGDANSICKIVDSALIDRIEVIYEPK